MKDYKGGWYIWLEGNQITINYGILHLTYTIQLTTYCSFWKHKKNLTDKGKSQVKQNLKLFGFEILILCDQSN